MSGPYMLLRGGRKVDLSNLRPQDIDLRAMVETMAQLPRYNAALDLNCSIAQHSIIATMCAPEAARPYVIAHDFHEYIFGDMTRPMQVLLEGAATCFYGDLAKLVVRAAIRETKCRLDAVIFKACGLPSTPPDWASPAIHAADMRAMATEIIVFNGGEFGGAEGWPREALTAMPLSPLPKPLSPEKAARELMALMERYLPVFNPLSKTA